MKKIKENKKKNNNQNLKKRKRKEILNNNLAILPSHDNPVFHASKLTQYSESTICGQKATSPPPTLIQGQEEWEVEKILDL